MTIKQKTIFIITLSIFSLLVLLILAPAALRPRRTSESPLLPQAEAIRITSPKENTVVIAGQTISVTVEPEAGVSLQYVSAWVIPLAEEPQLDEMPPFQIPVKIPEDFVGPASLQARAVDTNENPLDTSIRILVQRPGLPGAIEVAPTEIRLRSPDQSRAISVTGVFAEGQQVRVTHSPNTSYISTNPRVASVNASGEVRAVGVGLSSVVVTHGELRAIIPVRVGVFELRGDLDGDRDVDQDDLNIMVAARNTEATGPGDPRDLNSDGQIDALDARILVNLCSRANCATQ